MATWEITPETTEIGTVTNNNNGTFVFPKNTGTTDITYTITYTSEYGQSTLQYVLHAGEECQPTAPCPEYNIESSKQSWDCSGGKSTFTANS